MPEQVWVAMVTGGFGIIVALIHSARRENRKDHGIVSDSLDRIEQKIDRHIESHD